PPAATPPTPDTPPPPRPTQPTPTRATTDAAPVALSPTLEAAYAAAVQRIYQVVRPMAAVQFRGDLDGDGREDVLLEDGSAALHRAGGWLADHFITGGGGNDPEWGGTVTLRGRTFGWMQATGHEVINEPGLPLSSQTWVDYGVLAATPAGELFMALDTRVDE